MFFGAEQYASTPVADLLRAAARGHIGLDHRLLHAILDRPHQESIPGLLAFSDQDHDSDRLDLEEDLIAIFRQMGCREAIPFFMNCVRAQANDLSDDLMAAVVQLGVDVVEPLLRLRDELDPAESYDIPFLLGSLGVRDQRILNILLEWLEEDPADGAFCLGLYRDTAAKPALEAMLEKIASGDEAHDSARLEIEHALERLGAEPAPSEEDSFDIWSAYPETAEPQVDLLNVEELLEMLSSESAANRAAAARGFFNTEYPREVRNRLLALARNDAESSVRAACWEALGSDTNDPGTRQTMLARLADETAPPEERASLAVALAQEADDPTVRKWIIAFHDDPRTRAKALEAMWRSLDRTFADNFPLHLDDPDPDVRRQAIFGVGYLGVYAEATRLRRFFDDEEFRADALYAYALCVPADISRAHMKRLLRKIDDDALGLSPTEEELVCHALDQRMMLHGLDPFFFPGEEQEALPPPPAPDAGKVGRNDLCPCGSGKKYKKCCGR